MSDIVSTHVDSYVYYWEKEDPRYLLLRRREGKFYGHLWQGVAGEINEGETAAETAIRELKEETGLKPVRIFVLDHVSSFYQSYNDRIHLVPVFGIEVDSKNVHLSPEHAEYRWVDFETGLSLLAWKKQKEALIVIHEMLYSGDERIKWSEVDFK